MTALRILLLLLALCAPLAGPAVPPALAVQPDEVLADPALETRARAISQELRCLVCQNQSIDDSNAPLARDLRLLVRERLVAGDSDAEVIAFITRRYGDYVLLRPPFKATTLALWLGPPILFVIAGGAVLLYLRRRRAAVQAGGDAVPLSPEEQRKLARLLGEER